MQTVQTAVGGKPNENLFQPKDNPRGLPLTKQTSFHMALRSGNFIGLLSVITKHQNAFKLDPVI